MNLLKFSGTMANSADPDQTAPKEQSDLGLQCFAHAILSISHYLRLFWYMIK